MTRSATILEKLLFPDILQPVMTIARKPSSLRQTSFGMKGLSETVKEHQTIAVAIIVLRTTFHNRMSTSSDRQTRSIRQNL